jgi:GTP-binding protein
MSGSTSLQPRAILPRVAIVGRPNVGKSTLFNRLVGRRHTITDPTPGVTRDAVEAVCSINGRDVVLIDTGGYQSDGEGIPALVSKKSLDVIEEADLILLLVEVTQLAAEDHEFIEKLRPYSDNLMLVVNKTDNEKREADVWDFHSLGFDRVIPVSAEHGRNIGLLREELSKLLPAEKEQRAEETPENEICIVILGKPNTGKSTLLNRLVGYDRAIVSETPGTTRDVLESSFEFAGMTFRVLDTAGIRKKKSVHEAIEYYSVSRAIASVDRADVVFLMIDSTEGITEQDKKIANQIVKRGRGVVLVLSKWDLMADVANAFHAISDRTRFLFPQLDFAPIVQVSAHDGTGVEKLLSTAVSVRKQLLRQVSVSDLNRSLKAWESRHPLPYGRKRYRAKYLAQISTAPLRLALFVNKTKGFPGSWVSYLENNLRAEYDMDLVPISIELRGR